MAAEENDLYERSGAQSLYDSLDGDTKEMLSWAGVEGAMVGGDLELTGLWQGLSQWTREQLGEPFRALAGVVAVVVLCRLAGCFEGKHLGETAPLVGSLACARPAAGASAGSAPAGGGPGPKRLGLSGGQRSRVRRAAPGRGRLRHRGLLQLSPPCRGEWDSPAGKRLCAAPAPVCSWPCPWPAASPPPNLGSSLPACTGRPSGPWRPLSPCTPGCCPSRRLSTPRWTLLQARR